MSKIISLIVLFLFTVACNQKQPDLTIDTEAQIEAEVSHEFEGLIEAVKSFEVDAYLQYFDKEKFTSLNENGTVFHNFGDFENMFRQLIPALKEYKLLEFSKVKITVINHSTAILVNEYIAEVELQSGDIVSASGAGSQVWSKDSSRWKLVNISGSVKANH